MEDARLAINALAGSVFLLTWALVLGYMAYSLLFGDDDRRKR